MLEEKHISWFKQLSSILSPIIAILALVVSVRSCQIAENAQDLSRVEFKQDRQLVLEAKFRENGKQIFVAPINKDMRFLEGYAFLPTDIYSDEIPIRASGEFYHMGSVNLALADYFAKMVPKKEGLVRISDGHLPILIKSFYATKGTSYTDISLYVFRVTGIIFGEKNKAPSVKFSNLLFLERMDPFAPVNRKKIDDFLLSKEGYYLPPRPPQ